MKTINLRAHRAQAENFDEAFYHGLAVAIYKSIGMEVEEEQRNNIAVAVVGPMIDEMASSFAAKLEKARPRLIRTHRRYNRGFERRLLRNWGGALSQFLAIIISAHEIGSEFNETHRKHAASTDDFVFDALTGLHARSCRVASEVHHLLASGFPMGAMARCRTLHELSVTTSIIAEYGRKPGSHDLAERYLLHDSVLNWKDAINYQKCCAQAGLEPLTEAEFNDIKKGRDAVIQRFGKPFGADNGWAADLLNKDRPEFRDLEDLADLSHLRGYYKLASHEVHADSKGWRLNRARRGNIEYLTTGHVNFGLSDPAQLAINSLNLSTCHLLLCISGGSPKSLVTLQALQDLREKAVTAFADAEQRIEEKEQRFHNRAK